MKNIYNTLSCESFWLYERKQGLILSAILNLKDSFKKEPLLSSMDDSSISDIISQYNELKLGADAFIEKTNLSDDAMRSYLHTVESGNATVSGYSAHINTTNASLGIASIKAKAAAVGFGLLNAALTKFPSLVLHLTDRKSVV